MRFIELTEVSIDGQKEAGVIINIDDIYRVDGNLISGSTIELRPIEQTQNVVVKASAVWTLPRNVITVKEDVHTIFAMLKT